MPSTYSPKLRLELMATGENRSTWGNKANNDFQLIEQAIAGIVTVDMADGNVTLTSINGTTDQSRMAIVVLTGTNTAIRTVTIPTVSKQYIIRNNTTGGFAITVSNGAGTASVANNTWVPVWTDGTSIFAQTLAFTSLTGTATSGQLSGTYPSLTGTGALGAGSITSGFGSIDIGADALTAGVATFASGSTSGNWTVNGNLNVIGTTTTSGNITNPGTITDNGMHVFNHQTTRWGNVSQSDLEFLNSVLNIYRKSGAGGITITKNTTGQAGGGTPVQLLQMDDSGNLVLAGQISSSQNFVSTTINSVLAATGAGQVYLRPNGAGSATGQATVATTGRLTVAQDVVAVGTVYAGNGNANLASNGNTSAASGSVWAAWGANDAFSATNARIEARGQAWGLSYANTCVQQSRMAGYGQYDPGPGGDGGFTASAYVMVMARRVNGDQYSFGFRQPQLWIPNVGWFAAFPF